MWLESEKEPDDSDFIYMCTPDLKAVEVSLANNAFMHSHYSFTYTMSPRITLNQKPVTPFNGVVIDTAANHRSIMPVAH